jgi:hypothetical protein
MRKRLPVQLTFLLKLEIGQLPRIDPWTRLDLQSHWMLDMTLFVRPLLANPMKHRVPPPENVHTETVNISMLSLATM